MREQLPFGAVCDKWPPLKCPFLANTLKNSKSLIYIRGVHQIIYGKLATNSRISDQTISLENPF